MASFQILWQLLPLRMFIQTHTRKTTTEKQNLTRKMSKARPTYPTPKRGAALGVGWGVGMRGADEDPRK